MTAYLLLDHLFNLYAPAAGVALLLVLLSRTRSLVFKSKSPLAKTFIASVATVFIVNAVVLSVGLVLFGHDGKMATYAAMVGGAALALVVLQRGKKR